MIEQNYEETLWLFNFRHHSDRATPVAGSPIIELFKYSNFQLEYR